MARSAFNWSAFFGGEWSARAQGRIDDPRYKTAMSLCYNGMPNEEGSWIRRPNWQFVGGTHYGHAGKLLSIPYQQGGRALMELTADSGVGAMRLWVPPNTKVSGITLGDYPYTLYCDLYEAVTATGATQIPMTVSTSTAHSGWATGDTLVLFRANGGTIAARQFIATKSNLQAGATTPGLAQVAGGAIAGTTYFAKLAIVGPGNIITQASSEASLAVSANNLLRILSPPLITGAIGWLPYASLTTGTETLQNSGTVIPFGTNWTEPTGGLQSGAAPQITDGTANRVFTLTDSISGFGVDPTLPEFNSVAFIGHVAIMPTQYADIGTCRDVRVVATDGLAFTLHKNTNPYMLTTTYAGNVPTFVYQPAGFQELDGPFLDPFAGASQTLFSLGTVSPNGGNWNFQITDGAYSWVSSDVQRPLRVWNQPPLWASGTSYNLGDQVTYNGTFWKMGKASVPAGTAPGQSYASGGVTYTPWVLNPTAGYWAFGQVISVTNASTVVAAFNTPPNVNGATIDTWQYGVYTANQYPTCGTWADGRAWFAGALPNRIDATISGISVLNFPTPSASPSSTPAFSPTDRFGQVLDSSAVAETLASPDANDIYWMIPDEQGVVVGTSGGEWLVSATTGDEVVSPTNIKARQKTKFQCANIEPVRTGPAMMFVQGFLHKVFEYLTDAFTQRFTGRTLNLSALHLFGAGVAELAYQEEAVPLVWARQRSGVLMSCTYRRISRWATEPPQTFAWHQHYHGSGRLFEQIVSASRGVAPFYSSVAGITTPVLTNDNTQKRYIEVLAPMLDVSVDTPLVATFTDETLGGQAAQYGADNISGGGGGGGPGPGGGTAAHGTYYMEFILNTTAQAGKGPALCFGVASQACRKTGGIAILDVNECSATGASTTVYDSAVSYGGGAWAGYSDGQRVAMAVDTINKLVWFRNVTTNSVWSGAGSSTTVLGSGYTTSAFDTTNGIFPFFCGSGYAGTDQITIVALGATTGTKPAGYVEWGAVTWSTFPGVLSTGSSSVSMAISNAGLTAAVTTVVGSDTTWSVSTFYTKGTIVWYLGRAYFCNIDSLGNQPDIDTHWNVAQVGVFATGGKASP